MWWDGGQGGFGVGSCGHGSVGGFGFGGGQGLVGGFGVGLTTGGTITGGTTTGGTTTGGTTTGGTTTGGTTTVTGGTRTGGMVTGNGTEIVTVTGLLPVAGLLDPVPGTTDDGVEVVGVLPTDVEGVDGVGVTRGASGVTTVVGAGVADGVGVLVAGCCFGTTMSGLPPPDGGAEPK